MPSFIEIGRRFLAKVVFTDVRHQRGKQTQNRQ